MRYIHEFSINCIDKQITRVLFVYQKGIDFEIEAPEASKKAIAKLPVHIFKKGDDEENNECSVCKAPPEDGDVYKILPCKHEFHEDCILLWLKKVSF